MPEFPASDPTPTPKTPKTPATTSSASSAASSAPKVAPSRPALTPLVALVVAVIALIAAVFGLFYPRTGKSFSGDQTAEAKKNICTAANTVGNAVGINTNLANPGGADEIGGLAVAANARLALSGGGTFLLDRLEAQPATPADLHKAVTDYANTLQELSVNYMAGAGPASSVQQPLRDQLKTQFGDIANLCQE